MTLKTAPKKWKNGEDTSIRQPDIIDNSTKSSVSQIPSIKRELAHVERVNVSCQAILDKLKQRILHLKKPLDVAELNL